MNLWQQLPVERITIRPGGEWNYTLPVEVEKVESITWACDLAPAQQGKSDSRVVKLQLPSSLNASFGELVYTLRAKDGTSHTGRIIIRVRDDMLAPKVMQEIESEHNEAPASPPKRKKRKKVVIAPGSVPGNEKITGPEPPHQKPLKSPSSPIVPASAPAKPSGQPMQEIVGDYCVQVVKNGVPVPGLVKDILSDRTLAIGKSSSKGLPDIDLKGHFETNDLERECSRQQAEVFWSDERIYIKNLSERTMLKAVLADGTEREIKTHHCWSPDEVIAIPGGLSLKLQKR